MKIEIFAYSGDDDEDSRSQLKSVTIPNSVTIIGSYAFDWHNRLTRN